MLQVVIGKPAAHTLLLQKRQNRFRIDPHIHQKFHTQLRLPGTGLPAAVLRKPFIKIPYHKISILLLRIDILLRIRAALLNLCHHRFSVMAPVSLVPAQLPVAAQRLVRVQINLHIQHLPHLRQIERMQPAHDDIGPRHQLSFRCKSARVMVVVRTLYRIVAAQHPQILGLPVQIIGPRIQMRHFLPVGVAPLPPVVTVAFDIQNMILRQQFGQHDKQPALACPAVPGNTDRKRTAAPAVKGIAVHTVQIHGDHQNQEDTYHQCKDNIPGRIVRLLHALHPPAKN